MRPRRLHDQLAVTLRTSAGHQFRGEFGDPNGFPRPRREVANIPHRSLTVTRNSLAQDGDVVTYRGHQYLLCGQHSLTEGRIFLALEIQQWLSWARTAETTDLVTGLKKTGTPVVLNPALPVILDPIRYTEEVKFQKPVYRLLTGADVKEGDRFDNLVVTQVSNLLGIKSAELI